MEGLYREAVAADGDGDVPDAVQEQHLAAVLHGLFGACSRGYRFPPVAAVLRVLSLWGERWRKEEDGKSSCFSGWIFFVLERFGSVLVAVECGMWTVDVFLLLTETGEDCSWRVTRLAVKARCCKQLLLTNHAC